MWQFKACSDSFPFRSPLRSLLNFPLLEYGVDSALPLNLGRRADVVWCTWRGLDGTADFAVRLSFNRAVPDEATFRVKTAEHSAGTCHEFGKIWLGDFFPEWLQNVKRAATVS